MRTWPALLSGIVLFAHLCAAPTLLADSPFDPVVKQAFADASRREATRGNIVAIVNSGYEALMLRVHLIRNARRSIEVQTFIWTNDECGRLIMCELIEAARRGVRVRVVADHLVTDKDPDTVAFLATVHPNLQIKHYRPAGGRIRPEGWRTAIAGLFRFRDLNQRMHNKIMLFDEAILITGGRNIENTYYDHSTEMNFKDRDVLAIGPVAREAARSFEAFWEYRHSVASQELTDVAAAIAKNTFARFNKRDDYDFGGFFTELSRQADDPVELEARFVSCLRQAAKVTFVADKPGKNRRGSLWGKGRITRELTKVIGSATQTIFIQSPYLVLSPDAGKLFKKLKQRTPGLRIIVSSNSFASTDNTMAYSANYRLRAHYIEGLGLQIHEYKPHPGNILEVFPLYPRMAMRAAERQKQGLQSNPPFLCIHAKSFVVDRRVAFIGSYNLDPRSENLNTEVGLLIEDVEIARELEETIRSDTRARNSWVIAKRKMPLHLDKVNALIDGLLGLGPVDLWPIQNTSSFDLVPGGAECHPDHPEFYSNYREVGAFPGTEGVLSTKEISTRLYKIVGKWATPIL